MNVFFLFAISLISSSVMVVSAINPVHSIIWLVLSFINAAALFVLLNLDFMGMILLIIYVGAIAILFVFVIMLLNITSENLEININNLLPLVLFIVLSVITQVNVTGKSNISHSLESEIIQPINLSNPQILASKFYSLFDIYLILPSLILLIAMVGTIVLILSYNQTSKKQNLFIQVTRDKHNIPPSSYSNSN